MILARDQDLMLAHRIEDLNIRQQTLTLLLNRGIFTVGDLVKKEERHLREFDRFGPKCLDDVVEALAEHGLTLAKTDYAASR
jgi:DNA-directed RNA polymerase alpha subunit